MASKVPLFIGAGAVLASAVVLVFALKSDKQPATAGGTTTRTTASGSATGVTPAPVLPAGSGSSVAVAEAGDSRDSTVNGIKVRDHRKNGSGVPELPPNLHPPDARRISPDIVSDLNNKVRGFAMACGKQVTTGDRGAKPRVDIQVIISIKGGTASVLESVATLTDLSGPSIDTFKQCIQTKSVGVTSAAPDEADLERYSINLSMPLL